MTSKQLFRDLRSLDGSIGSWEQGVSRRRQVQRQLFKIVRLFTGTSMICLGLVLSAYAQQDITVRFLDYQSGKPIKKMSVVLTLWNGVSSHGSVADRTTILKISARTDNDGKVILHVPEPVPEHFSIFTPDLVEPASPGFSPADVLKSGATAHYRHLGQASKVLVSAKPGEVVIISKRLSAWDRMRQEIP